MIVPDIFIICYIWYFTFSLQNYKGSKQSDQYAFETLELSGIVKSGSTVDLMF